MQSSRARIVVAVIVAVTGTLSTGSLLAVVLAYRRVRNSRRAFGLLPRQARLHLEASLLALVHEGAIEKDQTRHGYARQPAYVLADVLALPVHLVDEGLRLLIREDFLDGVCAPRPWGLAVHLTTTRKGTARYQKRGRWRQAEEPWKRIVLPEPGPAELDRF